MTHIIRKGLAIRLVGEPEQSISFAPPARQVGLVADDYPGMKPTMEVTEGQRVAAGQVLLSDKKTLGVKYTSPAAGTVAAVNRGQKRRFLSVVIDVDGDEQVTFKAYGMDVSGLSTEDARSQLLESGLWTALRTRPFGKVPSPEVAPRSIFVNAMDTSPLAADPMVVIGEHREHFILGLHILGKLTGGTIYVAAADGDKMPGGDVERVQVESFQGPHPAGLVGTHIHLLDPVSATRMVWHLNYQDVIAFGQLFDTGHLPTQRVISIGGPVIAKPRLIRTQLGADVQSLFEGELSEPPARCRLISGSVLAGRTVVEPTQFLGRYHLQISALEEGNRRELLGWMTAGADKFSATRTFASALLGQGERFALTTSSEGSSRAMVPIGTYERVMPLDIVPTYLLRALIVRDTAQAQALGCLELDEEDLALCTYVCPGKYEYGPILRDNLNIIEREG